MTGRRHMLTDADLVAWLEEVERVATNEGARWRDLRLPGDLNLAAITPDRGRLHLVGEALRGLASVARCTRALVEGMKPKGWSEKTAPEILGDLNALVDRMPRAPEREWKREHLGTFVTRTEDVDRVPVSFRIPPDMRLAFASGERDFLKGDPGRRYFLGVDLAHGPDRAVLLWPGGAIDLEPYRKATEGLDSIRVDLLRSRLAGAWRGQFAAIAAMKAIGFTGYARGAFQRPPECAGFLVVGCGHEWPVGHATEPTKCTRETLCTECAERKKRREVGAKCCPHAGEFDGGSDCPPAPWRCTKPGGCACHD